MTWIKICGTTTLEDARLAADAGADALGFIFAPSARRITASQASVIIRDLHGDVAKVGIFANGIAKDVAAVASEVGLTFVQLYGNQGTASLKEMEEALGPKMGIIRAIPGERMADEFLLSAAFALPNRAVLLDNTGPDGMGGTGTRFEWSKIALRVRAAIEHFKLNFIIAGGLTPENVGEAIRLFHPWGVDVVSGVEAAPGKKDPARLRAFIRAVREADKSAL